MIKHYLIIGLCLSLFTQVVAQERPGRPFITADVNLTFGINEFYTPFDTDDGEMLIEPTAMFLRVGFGYEFKKRLAVSVNGGYDLHWKNTVDAFPAYFGLRYNITENDDDAHFFEVRYGKLFTPSSRFPDGNYFGLGVGVQIAGHNRFNTIVRLDFHRKGITGFKNDRLDSVSLGVGFSFF
jgi:hypothetical protein